MMNVLVSTLQYSKDTVNPFGLAALGAHYFFGGGGGGGELVIGVC